jgi:hypothetical protein
MDKEILQILKSLDNKVDSLGNKFEIVTASNWANVAKLKAIK